MNENTWANTLFLYYNSDFITQLHMFLQLIDVCDFQTYLLFKLEYA